MARPLERQVRGAGQTAASHRTIPLPQVVVVDALAAHLASYPVEHPDGLIFTTENGETIRRNRVNDGPWKRATTAAGLEVGFHDLRHHYASALIRFGESVKVVQLRLGHSSASETWDTYSHLWPDNEDRTRDAIDSILGRSEDSMRTAPPAEG